MNIATHIIDIPSGDDGTAKTINIIKRFADVYSTDFKIITIARNIVSGTSGDKTDQADALFYFVKENVRYIDDPTTVEMVQSPMITLQAGWGDCDDFAVLLATLNQAIGNNVGFVTVSQEGEKEYSHVFLAVFTDKGVRFYDPTIKESYPGWHPKDFGRARLWIDSNDYRDLAGFFSSIKKIFKKLGNVFEKIYKELKRVERRIRKERNRVFTRIVKEFTRWEHKLGPFGKFLILGSKVGIAVLTGGLLAPASFGIGIGIGTASTVGAFWGGQAINFSYNTLSGDDTPWTMTDEEWKALVSLATSIGSLVLSFVPGIQALLIQSIANLAGAGMSILDLEQKKQSVKEAIEKLKDAQVLVSFEARLKREALGKLESDIFLLENILALQKESEIRISEEQEKTENLLEEIWNKTIQEIVLLKNGLESEILKNTNTLRESVIKTLQAEIAPIWGILTFSQKKEIQGILAGIRGGGK